MSPEEEPSTTIADPSKYTVTFGDDGSRLPRRLQTAATPPDDQAAGPDPAA